MVPTPQLPCKLTRFAVLVCMHLLPCSFTVLAAAQTAMACALKRDATSKISEKDFFFCKSPREGEIRTCDNSWNMLDGILVSFSGRDTGKGCYPERQGTGTRYN